MKKILFTFAFIFLFACSLWALDAGQKSTYTLAAGEVLTVTAPPGATGLAVRLSRLAGGGDAQSVTAINGATLTFGPYAQSERFEISITKGSVTVTSAIYTPSDNATDTELAAIIASSISNSDVTHCPDGNSVYDALALKAPLASPTFTGTVTAPLFTAVNATATNQDIGIFTFGTWTDDGAHDINITGQTAHFVPFQANISADTDVAKDIAAARFRVNTGTNTTGAIGNLQLRQKISHNVASAAILNASTNIGANTTVGTGSILGGYFSIEGSGVITKAGDNDCTPLVAVNNNTGGGIDNVFVAMMNGVGTTVSEIIHAVVEHGTATTGINIEKTANGTALNTGLKFTGTIGTEIDFQNGETIDNTINGALSVAADIYPKTDDTYYLGKNDDDTPFAYKGLILKDTTNGKYYRIEMVGGNVTATDLTD